MFNSLVALARILFPLSLVFNSARDEGKEPGNGPTLLKL